MLNTIERRQFLHGNFRTQPVSLLPPWSGPRAGFFDLCTRCGTCLSACPNDILVAGDGGYPEVDFRRGECSFCGDCLRACKPRALSTRAATPWHLVPVVHDTCLAWQGIDCRRCSEMCAAGALRISLGLAGTTLPVIDATSCNGCGACVAPCPVSAIRLREAA